MRIFRSGKVWSGTQHLVSLQAAHLVREEVRLAARADFQLHGELLRCGTFKALLAFAGGKVLVGFYLCFVFLLDLGRNWLGNNGPDDVAIRCG